MSAWSVTTLLAILLVLVGCPTGDDDDDVQVDDDDTDGGIPDCGDLDLQGLGQAVPYETLVCDQSMMDGELSGWEGPSDEDWPVGAVLSSQQELDAFLEDHYMERHLPCPVDLESSQILATFFWKPCGGCAHVEICGVHDDGDVVTVTVLFIDASMGNGDLSQGFHLALIDQTATPIEFSFREFYVESLL